MMFLAAFSIAIGGGLLGVILGYRAAYCAGYRAGGSALAQDLAGAAQDPRDLDALNRIATRAAHDLATGVKS